MKLYGRQRGAALMAMLMVIVLGGAWWLVSGLRAASNRTAIDRSHNARVLAEAKAALIAWAASTAADPTEKFPGRLPCPEGAAWIGTPNAEGIAAPGVQPPLPATQIAVATCSSVGRLPWRTLGLDKLTDAAGEPLWYVVTTGSAGWAFSTSGTDLSINSNKAGTLTVDGVANAAVAAIIAPGRPLSLVPNSNQTAAGCVARAQSRTPSAPTDLDYLECQGTSSSPITLRTSVVDNATNPVSNDQVVVITAAEVLAAIEPVVAQRIQNQVVPQLQSIYADPTWGTSTANPAFPFAVTFGDPGASTFKGTAAKTEGFLPLNASVCAAATTGATASTGTTGRCDSTFVAWNTSSISAVQTGGTATILSSPCTASTTTQISCTITYSKTTCGTGFCNGAINVDVKVQGDASNVGMALRTLDTTAFSGLSSSAVTAPLQSSGAARATYTGTVSTPFNWCWAAFGFPCGGTATVTVPISAFQDHPFLNPTVANNWYWFLANNWHHVTYYAVAPMHAPGGAGNCSGTTCISVTVQGGTNLSGKRAVLALAGRSLNNTSGTNRALSDFLDSTENTNLDLNFEQYKGSRSFNDRFAGISP